MYSNLHTPDCENALQKECVDLSGSELMLEQALVR